MSLNIVDSLLDKLSLVSKDKNIPFGKKFTGSQNFLGTNYISQSIPTEFQSAFMDDESFSLAHNKMNRSSSLDSKMNIFHYLESTNDRLVSRVSKLLSPPLLSSHDSFRIVPNYLEILRDQELFLNQGFKMFCEEVEQHFEKLNKTLESKLNPGKDTSKMQTSSVESPCKQTNQMNPSHKSDKNTQQINLPCVNSTTNQSNAKSNADTCLQSSMLSSVESTPNQSKVLNSHLKSGKYASHRPDFSSSVKHPSKEMMQDVTVSPLVTVVLQENKNQLTNNHAMNEKLTNRKNKELQKRSKKRRRRQKKNNKMVHNTDCATKAESDKLKNETKTNASNAARTSPSSALHDSRNKSSDILCDIVTIAESASGVQILLPNSSSFVISIESAEDDSDWDSNSDCEWLNDCSEFEFSGIFISNLSAPFTSTLSKGVCISQLSVASSPSDEVEMHRLGAVLRRVNDNWVKAMKGLDTKPRVATKVSFAPDDELVEVMHVDIFDRKGEWETYATERMRFKRRIDELEKVITPCLSKQHREKIFSRFQESDL